MARHYKQIARVSPRELVSHFKTQRVPAVLFDYATFSRKYKGLDPERVATDLDAETDMFKLPQTVHLASCAAFNSDMRQISEDERCLVAHAFEDGSYADAQECIWLIADIESKLELDVEATRAWCERFETLANSLNFRRFQIWLIANEG